MGSPEPTPCAVRKIGTTETGPAPTRDGDRGALYAYRVRGASRSGIVLWIAGTGDGPDRVLTSTEGGRRRVPVFVTARQARLYVRRHGKRLAGPEVAGPLELVRVQHWLADPARRRVPPGQVLDAWNFFEDLARGIDAHHPLLTQGPVQDSAYEKLATGECAAWTPEERNAVLGLLTAGLELWDHARTAA